MNGRRHTLRPPPAPFFQPRRLAVMAIAATVAVALGVWLIAQFSVLAPLRAEELWAQGRRACSLPLSPEELDVLLAALPAQPRVEVRVFGRQTVLHRNPFLRLAPRSERTWRDLLDKNDEPRCLPVTAAGREWTLFSEADVPRDLGRGHFREWFHNRYANAQGISRASRPGFSPSGDEALIELYYHCGGLCGQGEQVLLMRDGAGWRVVSRALTWIS